VADAIGLPGQREFYVQARKGPVAVSFLVEKTQVVILADRLVRILDRLAGRKPEDAGTVGMLQADLHLELPVTSEYRVGGIALGYDDDADTVLLEFWNIDEEEERYRITVTREQARAFARFGQQVCAAGRPECILCRRPLDEPLRPGAAGHPGCPILN
jgi:uncharacterized repeat protein (TIGR03847 family)